MDMCLTSSQITWLQHLPYLTLIAVNRKNLEGRKFVYLLQFLSNLYYFWVQDGRWIHTSQSTKQEAGDGAETTL